MSQPVYTTELLRLAASLSDPRPLDREDGAIELRSQTCGSRVSIAVQLDGQKRIDRLAIRVHACAFGQASAALVERHSRGRTRSDIAAVIVRLNDWLDHENDGPPPWPDLRVLEPARPRKARHAAILLPFRALLAALETAA